ncbi:hypothetical protein FX983_06534 [Pseudomonas frederiksbergensis]|uniref:Uncharacterized protein n=1 Tax=Pseudomonas frederiksbergensis TaxID=104087 RepID=A0A6L5BTV8_9PSED|nr:hypothetical protein FX983_06534 [Pseudomonas frederiksbergensis]
MQACGAYAKLPRLGPQASAQLGVHLKFGFLDATAVALHLLQTEGQRRLVDIAEHLAEKVFVLRLTDTQTCLGNVVAVRHRCGQTTLLTQQVRLHFLLHHFQRGVVEGDVVEQQHRHPTLIGRVLGHPQAHQRRLADIETVMTRVETRVQLGHDIAVVGVQRHVLDAEPGLAPDHLHRLLQALPKHRRAQDIVAVDYALQCLSESLKTRLAVEGKQRLQDVRVTLPSGNMVVENAFLQRRQRVNILHVGRAAGNLGDDAINRVLVQRGQRQHRRGDPFAVRGDAIRGHLDFIATTHSGGQRGQGRLAEQHAHVGAELDLTHLLDQVDRQQRMPAQFEEVIVTTDALDIKHLRPEPRQGDFDFALRRFIAPGDDGCQVRHRQRLAVELAVGGQRQAVELHIRRRHHVVRQRRLQMSTQAVEVRRAIAGEISHQAFFPGHVFTYQHHRVFHAFVLRQAGFDFTQFDAVATDFHLVIVAAQVLNAAVRQVAPKVAGAVHRLTVERVGDEFFRAQFGTVQIAVGNPRASDKQLTGHTQGYGAKLCVEHVDPRVADRPANRNAAGTD